MVEQIIVQVEVFWEALFDAVSALDAVRDDVCAYRVLVGKLVKEALRMWNVLFALEFKDVVQDAFFNRHGLVGLRWRACP